MAMSIAPPQCYDPRTDQQRGKREYEDKVKAMQEYANIYGSGLVGTGGSGGGGGLGMGNSGVVRIIPETENRDLILLLEEV